MGISPSLSRAILQEHSYKPITGQIVLIGRQSMGMTLQEAQQMCFEQGVTPMSGMASDQMLDTTTRAGEGKGWISDKGFFSLFTEAPVTTIDVTDYEGADIVHDMHEPIPASMEGIADFLWIGSCLDNMSDPITALQNSTRILKTGGRLVDMEIAVPKAQAYLIFSPEYFFDYFAVNKFRDCKVYVCAFAPEKIHGGPWHFFSLADFEATRTAFPLWRFASRDIVLTYVVAEKGDDTTWNKKPVQAQYRPSDAPYAAAFEAWQKSSRPKLTSAKRFMLPRHVNRLLPRSMRTAPEVKGFDYIGQI